MDLRTFFIGSSLHRPTKINVDMVLSSSKYFQEVNHRSAGLPFIFPIMGQVGSKKARSEIARQTAAVAASRMPATRVAVSQNVGNSSILQVHKNDKSSSSSGSNVTSSQNISLKPENQNIATNRKESIEMNPELVEFLRGAGPVSAKLNPNLSKSTSKENRRIRKYDDIQHDIVSENKIKNHDEQHKPSIKESPWQNMMKEDHISSLLYEIHRIQGSRKKLMNETMEQLTLSKTFNLSTSQLQDIYADIGVPKIAGERLTLSDIESEFADESKDSSTKERKP